VHGGEVAGPDDHVGIGAHLDQACGLNEVAMKVREGQDPHRFAA
jgi:hypothetical protein